MGEKALLRACKEMLAAEKIKEWDDAEIVGSSGQYWLGSRRVSTQTVNIGLWNILFRSEGMGSGYERHTLNERGRSFAETGQLPALDLKAPSNKP